MDDELPPPPPPALSVAELQEIEKVSRLSDEINNHDSVTDNESVPEPCVDFFEDKPSQKPLYVAIAITVFAFILHFYR